MLYLIQTTVYCALLYGVYLLLLRNRVAHAWNRAYLLAVPAISLLLPLVHLPGGVSAGGRVASIALPAIDVLAGVPHMAGAKANWLQYSYIIIAGGMLAAFGYQLALCASFLRSSSIADRTGAVRILKGTGRGPGSFGRYIFFPGYDMPAEVLQHELAHVRHRHTIDVVYMRLLQCIFWPNIMLYIIGRELRVVHEFEADAYASKAHDNYAHSLLAALFPGPRFGLSHTFFHHPIKRRIIMLQRESNDRATLRNTIARSAVTTLLMASAIIYLQSCTRQQEKAVEQVKQEATVASTDGEEVVAAKPSVDIQTFMAEQLKYPEEARKRQMEGRVMIGFTVNEQGEVVTPVVKSSPDPLLAAEALRVISKMPRWEPATKNGKAVASEMYIPVVFKLQ